MTVQADKQGRLKMLLENDMIKIGTHFQNLDVPRMDNESSRISPADDDNNGNSQGDSSGLATVKIELRRFNLFLHAEQINAKKVIANLVTDKMMHIFLVHDDIYMQYYIPAINE